MAGVAAACNVIEFEPSAVLDDTGIAGIVVIVGSRGIGGNGGIEYIAVIDGICIAAVGTGGMSGEVGCPCGSGSESGVSIRTERAS